MSNQKNLVPMKELTRAEEQLMQIPLEVKKRVYQRPYWQASWTKTCLQLLFQLL